MRRGKIPRYTHRLMHRKRVTCELHDSYLCLMTIKHAIPRTAEMTHPGGQSWGDIEWAIELLYNSVKTGSQLVWSLETRWWRDAVEKANIQQRGLPGLRLSSPGEQERHNADGHKSGGQYVAVFVLSPPPSHTQTFQIKWEVYFFKRSLRPSLLLRQYVFCMYICIYAYLLYGYTTVCMYLDSSWRI